MENTRVIASVYLIVGITITVAAIIIKNMPDKNRSQHDGKSVKNNMYTRQGMK
ncbi:hypothetical protein SAMN02745945_02034 [Peptoclostridium litorale DSM 5388]|uniref:Uncharacterized protein n=1 Tax=Peptoclostridium litorale DSM 5388 TaxID=1121324 RepID=A0A069RFF9_PEPLI|nr:hypothetical protein [Peptoclostridium litorale]KDR95523.1 hypothetical protein CLIT_10c02500 [Peptoclostridium litorale DSM 5388]SIO16868.1 hypothetical protein SAMN02745945_02034 [Peptoclostridium litorale DSM 5388]